METDYNEEKFKAHIKAFVEAAEGGDTLEERPLTLSELKELALSMGMSESEWEGLQKKAVVHLTSAGNHLKARNFDEAISEAEKATAINPYLTNGNAILAKSYQMLWLEDDNEEARKKAEYYARKELLVDPKDSSAINVLSAINKTTKNAGKENKNKRKFLLIGGIILLLFIAGYFFISNTESSTAQSSIKNELIEAQEEVYSKYDMVQTAIDKRNNMLPDLFNAVDGNNSALNRINKDIDKLKKKIQKNEGEKRFELEAELDEKIAEAKRLAQKHGNSNVIETLLVQIEGAENRITFEKKSYNDAVKRYNVLVKQNDGKDAGFELEPYYNAH